MERFAMQHLAQWKVRKDRKPLIVPWSSTDWKNLAFEGVRQDLLCRDRLYQL